MIAKMTDNLEAVIRTDQMTRSAANKSAGTSSGPTIFARIHPGTINPIYVGPTIRIRAGATIQGHMIGVLKYAAGRSAAPLQRSEPRKIETRRNRGR